MVLQDIKNREDIHLLVKTFYGKVRNDDVLAPFFEQTIKDWESHFKHLTSFWESQLFLQTKYTGNPIEVHVKVDKISGGLISEKHFGIWLNLWVQTIDDLFKGEYANRAKHKARKMSTFLYLNIFSHRNHS